MPSYQILGSIPKPLRSATKLEKVYKKFLKFQAPNTIFYSLPFSQKYYKHPIYSPSFHHLLRLIILFLPRKVVEISIFKTQIENYVSPKTE